MTFHKIKNLKICLIYHYFTPLYIYLQNLQRDRKVGFAPEVDEESSKDHRLRRRDTPHYLKNKRVHKEEDAEQKVLEILAQAAKQRDGAALSPVVKVGSLSNLVY